MSGHLKVLAFRERSNPVADDCKDVEISAVPGRYGFWWDCERPRSRPHVRFRTIGGGVRATPLNHRVRGARAEFVYAPVWPNPAGVDHRD